MSEILKNPEQIQQPSALSELQEKLARLKEQRDYAVGKETEEYQNLVNMAVEMAEGNLELSKKSDETSRGYENRKPGEKVPNSFPAHNKSLEQFRHERETEVVEKRKQIQDQEKQLAEIKETLEQLKNSENVDQAALEEISKEISQQEALLQQQKEEIAELDKSIVPDYNELAAKFRRIRDEQQQIAYDQPKFAAETVAEMSGKEFTPDQLKQFADDVKAGYELNRKQEYQKEELERESKTLKEYQEVVEYFENGLDKLKEMNDQDLGKIYNEKTRSIDQSVVDRFQEIDQKIKKELNAFIFSRKGADRAADLLRDYDKLKQEYYSELVKISNRTLDLLNDAHYGSDEFKKKKLPTLEHVSGYAGYLAKHTDFHPNLKNEGKSLHEEAEQTQRKALELYKSIEKYRQQIQHKAINEINEMIDKIIPKSQREEYLAKIKKKRGY